MRAGLRGLTLLLAVLLTFLAAGAAQARESDPVAVGRYHLRKANQLAGEDHCHSAIHEYTLAYEKLRDPFVLFNRAECYRRIGQAEKAISDYRAFLEGVPAAPNRADIEAKISALAALTRVPPPVAAAEAPPSAAQPKAPSKAKEPPRQPVVVLPPVEIEPPPAEPPSAPPAAVLSQPAPPAPAADISSASSHSSQSSQSSQSSHTWIWIALAAVVVGGAAGAYVALRAPATTPPPTDLGNYKF